MIKELNNELNIEELDQMMNDLEKRDEFICFFDACFGKASLCICLGVACTGYIGIGIGACVAGI